MATKKITINESALKKIISESVKSALREMFEDNSLQGNEYYEDALEAIEMSDGCIDFQEWYPAFYDELDEDEAEQIFNSAMEAYERG